MTQIKHHLSDALLMGYAAGSLPEAFNLVVATHISMCDECRAALAEYDAIGGEVMLDADPIDREWCCGRHPCTQAREQRHFPGPFGRICAGRR